MHICVTSVNFHVGSFTSCRASERASPETLTRLVIKVRLWTRQRGDIITHMIMKLANIEQVCESLNSSNISLLILLSHLIRRKKKKLNENVVPKHVGVCQL